MNFFENFCIYFYLRQGQLLFSEQNTCEMSPLFTRTFDIQYQFACEQQTHLCYSFAGLFV